MKSQKLTLISGVLLTLLVIGTGVLLSSSGQEPLIAEHVKLIPKHIDMRNTPDLIVELKLFIETEGENVSVIEEIDPSTILLEGMIAPIDTWIEYLPNGKPKNFYAEFKGCQVKGMIWYIITHMGLSKPNPSSALPIRLTITGQLYDDTPWEGSVTAVVVNLAGGTPPPPPPPP